MNVNINKILGVGIAVLVLVLIFLLVFGKVGFSGKVISQNQKTMEKFVDCLNYNNIVLYGFDDNPQVKAQLSLFGNYANKINMVDCSTHPESCEGVILYPSWKVSEYVINGGLSLGALSKFSGCALE